MNMNLRRLLSDGSIERFQSNRNQINDKMEIAEKHLRAAQKIVQMNDVDTDDSAYLSAYNAILEAGYALMFDKGYRPKDRSRHHLTVQRFIESEFSNHYAPEVISTFGSARQTRNTLNYDTTGILTHPQVEDLISKATIFVNTAKTLLNTT